MALRSHKDPLLLAGESCALVLAIYAVSYSIAASLAVEMLTAGAPQRFTIGARYKEVCKLLAGIG